MKPKKILFAGAGSAQTPAIVHANELGYITFALDGNRDAPGFECAKNYVVGDIRDPNFIKFYAEQFKVDAIVSIATDVAVPSVARACSELGLPALSVISADISVNKLMQRKKMKEAGLNLPKFESFKSLSQAMQLLPRIGFPLVIKPIDSAGSRGVKLVNSVEEMVDAVKDALIHSKLGVGLIEEFIEGPEVSVEGFVVNGELKVIALTEKYRSSPPYLLDTSVHFPDNLKSEERELIIAEAKRAVQSCNLDSCPVHMEVLRSKSGPIVVELGARGPGFRVFTNILPYVTGVDTVEVQLRLALGLPIELTPYKYPKGAAIAFINPTPGKLRRVSGLDNARRIPGVMEAEVYIKPGQIMGCLKSGSDRIGHVIVYGKDRNDADSVMSRALSFIKIEVD